MAEAWQGPGQEPTGEGVGGRVTHPARQVLEDPEVCSGTTQGQALGFSNLKTGWCEHVTGTAKKRG